MPEDSAAAATIAPAARAEEARKPVALDPRPVKRARPCRRDQDSQASSRVPSAAMPQDSTAAAMVALAARKEEAREALEVAIAEIGTNPARVEAAERGRDELRRQRDKLLALLTGVQKGDALVRAAQERDTALAAHLLVDGAGPDAVGSPALEEDGLEGWTALGVAIKGRHQVIINMLLEAGVLSLLADEQKGDVLVLAAHYNNAFLTARLIAHGVGPDAVGSTVLRQEHLEGITPLVAAIVRGHDEIFGQLMAADVDCEKESISLRPLMWAANLSRPDCLRRLLAAGAAVNTQDESGMTALHHVTDPYKDSPRHSLCARLLLDRSADKDTQDAEGRTPLMLAAFRNFPGIVAMLLEEGANRVLVDGEGRTALVIAEEEGHDDVEALLRR